MKATAGEVYTVYNQYLKRYTACQVAYIAPPDTVSKESWAVVLSLDWVGDAPLTAEELPHLRPLYKDFMYWPRDLHLLRVPLEVPPQYTLVGTLPPFTDQPCRSDGGWSDGYEVYLQIRWQAIPEERRRAFKEAMESDEQTEIGGIQLKVSSHRVMDQYAPFDSALELKALPCLSELICERWHPDLLEFLRETPFVDEVTLLNHGQRTLDLRGTSIRKLMLDMTGLEELWLCEGTELLLFQNKGPDACAIHAPEDGSGLTLQFIGEYRPHTELPNLRGLHGIELKDFDLTGLAAVHPHLKELRLWGAPGNLGNFSAVRGFRELTNLSTFDLFGFGADDIPTPEQMPELRWFWMTSLPETAANASIFVNKELQRVTRGALDDLSDKGVIKKFPPCIASTHTALVLKEPKTKTSIRRVYLPKTVAKMLVDRKAEIDELKDLFGDEYIDNDLVFCTSNGRPMESQIINRAFNKLIKENGFPHVVFHSLRHSSITYKLKLNGGDMKAVQGDSGHAQMKMVADVYSHIIDEDRCINAQRFEDAFYSQAKAPEPAIQEVEEKETGTTTVESDTAKILELLKNPETAALLKQIVSAL